MNDFVNIVKANGYGNLLDIHRFKNFKPKGNDELTSCLSDIVNNNLKVMIDPDTDPDGFFAALTVKETLDELKHYNYTINQHTVKRHGIPRVEILRAVHDKYDYVIIVDSSTNQMDDIIYLVNNGVKVIIIDHHQTNYVMEDYPKGSLVINSTMAGQDNHYNKLSACALTAILMNNSLTDLGREIQQKFYVYAYITLYSDSCDLSSELNISIIHMAEQIKRYVPDWIKRFMSQWDELNRSFIEYKFIPRINALVRMNMFNFIDLLFYGQFKHQESLEKFLVKEIEENYKEARQLTEDLAKLTEVTEFNKFVIADMDSAINRLGIETTLARNFTGVVASKIMQQYNKTTMTLMDMDRNLEGSVRDPFNRDILKVFKQFITANGHKAAFGVKINKYNYQDAIDNINYVDHMLDLDESKTIIIDGDNTDDFDIQVRIMGEYNELSGGTIPVGFIRKVVTSDCVVTKFDKFIRIKWRDYEITAFADNVFYQDIIIMKPTVTKKGYSLIANNVL